MSQEISSENPIVTLRSGHILVDGQMLSSDALAIPGSSHRSVSAEELQALLLPNRRPLQSSIKEMPGDEFKISLWTTQLGNTDQTDGRDTQVFSRFGYENNGLITTRYELAEAFHGHWDAVYNVGFVPEVRRDSTHSENGGAWLTLHKPTLAEVAFHWLDWAEDPVTKVLQRYVKDRPDAYKDYVKRYRVLAEGKIDRRGKIEGDAVRPRWQLAVDLGVAALKLNAGDVEAYERDIDDAFDKADSDEHITVETIRAIENSTF